VKVLHLPTSVGGNSWGLAQAEKSLGLDSTVLVSKQNWLKYDANIKLSLEDKNFIFQLITSYKTFKEIRNKYDVFHFNYGSSLLDLQKLGLPLLELPYYESSKKIIFTYNGSDCRGVHPLEYWENLDAPNSSFYKKLVFKMKELKVKKASRYADHIFALNPDLMHYLPENTTFLPYTIANWNKINKLESDFFSKPIKIVHSPTSRDLKGSKYILDALYNLQAKYKNIEILIIENVPHNKALKMYMEADIVVDQVLIGWYGAFGVEVMKMGKPLAVYIREEDLQFIPNDMAKDLKEAIINISPFNIYETLSEYIENRNLLVLKSIAGLDYVHKWHNPKYTAKITKEVYEAKK
jgi:hypothetical protein